MRIVSLITKLDYSGGPKMLAWVTNQFALAGHDVHLISIYGERVEREIDEAVKLHFLNLKQSVNWLYRNTWEVVNDIKVLDQMIERINPDVILSFIYAIDVYYLVYSKLLKRNKYCFLLSMRLDPFSQKRIPEKLRNKMVGLGDGFVFQTDEAKSYYTNAIQKKSTVIFNPVTTETMMFASGVKRFADRKDYVVLPARLYLPQKRQDVAIKAFKIVIKHFPRLKLMLLGDGPDLKNLKDITKSEGIRENVIFHSSVKHAESIVGKCKIMILTSDYEGIPNSLLEAMSIGVNVISTDCSPGGARALVENGKNGFIVPIGDSDALAARIIELMNDSNLADKLASNAKMVVNKFSEKEISRQWNSYLNEHF